MPSQVFSERPTRLYPVPPRAPATVDAGGWSAKGSARCVNEDSFLNASIAEGQILLAVADGMGGEAAGERASRVATQSLVRSLSVLPTDRIAIDPQNALEQAFVRAHLDVVEDGQASDSRFGMGTTLTAGLILWPRVHVIHAGDSRGYHLRRGMIRQLTKDHTVAEILIDRGQLTREAARKSKYRHILANHLGGDARMPDLEMMAVDLEAGDALLFTTDGLSEALEEAELAEIASRPCSAHAVCHMLVEAARAKGTRDDATAAFVRFGLPL